MKELNEYSKRFSEILFQSFPEWQKFLSVQNPDDPSENGYLLVKVPAPSKSLIESDIPFSNKDFLIISSDEEITIGFDYYHTHFDSFSNSDEKYEFSQAVEFTKLIVEEKICPVSVFNNQTWCGSTYIEAGEKPDLSDWKNLNELCRDVYIRSWRGTHNQKYDISEVSGENKKTGS